MKTNASIGNRLSVIVALAAVACIAALALSLGFGARQAWAGGNPDLESLKDKTFTLSYKGKTHDMGYRDYYSSEAGYSKITKVKSSNAKVATAKARKMKSYDGKTVYYLRVTLKKAGTTKLSFKHDGKKYVATYKVKNFVNPLKSLKVGSKDYVSYCDRKKLGRYCYYASETDVPVKAFSGKVVAKAKSGWEIDSIITYPQGPLKVIKNGGKAKNAGQLGILLTNMKTGQFEGFYLKASASKQLRASSQLRFASV